MSRQAGADADGNSMNWRSQDRRLAGSGSRLGAIAPLISVWSIGAGIIAVALLQRQTPSENLFLDATHVGGQRWYVGMVASLGMLAWTASVCFCLTTGWVAGLAGRSRAQSAFRGAGLLFAVLLLDDLFLFHSDLLPHTVGIPKLVVLAMYGLAAVLWIAASATEIVRTRYQFLLAAAMAFGLSLTVEVLLPGSDSGLRGVVEDGSKFLGILALALWSVTSTTDVIRSVVASDSVSPTSASSRRGSAPSEQRQSESVLG